MMNKSQLMDMIKQVAIETARAYVADVSHGDFYAFPINGKGARKGLQIAIYPRAAVLASIKSGKIFNACTISDNILKYTRAQFDRVCAAFGKPLELYATSYDSYEDIPIDANGLRATTFEKLTIDIVNQNGFAGGGYKWTGSSTTLQYDGVNGLGVTVECKGIRGRLTKFIK